MAIIVRVHVDVASSPVRFTGDEVRAKRETKKNTDLILLEILYREI